MVEREYFCSSSSLWSYCPFWLRRPGLVGRWHRRRFLLSFSSFSLLTLSRPPPPTPSLLSQDRHQRGDHGFLSTSTSKPLSPLLSSPAFTAAAVGLLPVPERDGVYVSECAAAAAPPARDPSTKAAGAANERDGDGRGGGGEADAGFPLLLPLVPSLDAGSTAPFQWKAAGGMAGRAGEGRGTVRSGRQAGWLAFLRRFKAHNKNALGSDGPGGSAGLLLSEVCRRHRLLQGRTRKRRGLMGRFSRGKSGRRRPNGIGRRRRRSNSVTKYGL